MRIPFTLCFSTLGCPELTLDESVRLAEAHRIPAIELRALESSIDLLAIFERIFGLPSSAKEWIAAQPVRIAALGTSFRIIGNSAADRGVLARLAEWADAFDCPYLRVFDGGESGSKSELAEAADALAWWRDLRRSKDWAVDIMVETHDAFAAPPALMRFLAADSACHILWDAHHTWRKGGEAPTTTWGKIHERVVHLHVKDSRISDNESGYAYCLPGEGEFPMRPLVDMLVADGFRGVVSFEWEKLWHPDLATLPEALDAARQHAWWPAGSDTAPDRRELET